MTTYQQLISAKKEIAELKEDLNCLKNRIVIVLNNIDYTNYNDDIIKTIRIDTERALKVIRCLEYEVYDIIGEDNNEKLNREIKLEFLESLSDILDVGYENELLSYLHLENIEGFKNYKVLKGLSKQCQNLLIDTPKNIINNVFNCNVVDYEEGEVFDPNTMTACCAFHEVIDDYKLLRNIKLGDYVVGTELPAIIDKETNETYVKAQVGINKVVLSDRLSRFHFVK